MADEVAQVCGLSVDDAQKLLAAAGGDVTSALQMHFDAMDEDDGSDEQQQQPDRPAAAASAPAPSSSRPVQQPRGSTAPSRAKKTGIASLRDYRDQNEDDDDDDDENYYAGGKSSGQVVQGNSSRDRDGRKAVSNIFKKAMEHGAMSDEQFAEQEGKGNNKKPKWGRGNRLGDTSEPATEGGAAAADESMGDGTGPEQADEIRQERVIRFWQDGFSVDDGPLRRRDDPTNIEFLNSISRGEVPMELRTPRPDETQDLTGRRILVHVRIEDNLDKEFTPPKKVFKPFGGGGNTLGSPVPDMKGANEKGVKLHAVPAAQAEKVEVVSVDESKPTTKLQIRLHNGTRMVMNFNHDHTVGDLRNVMARARTDGPAAFEIRQTMPPRVFEDDTMTLEAAGLLKACVTQRPIKD